MPPAEAGRRYGFRLPFGVAEVAAGGSAGPPAGLAALRNVNPVTENELPHALQSGRIFAALGLSQYRHHVD